MLSGLGLCVSGLSFMIYVLWFKLFGVCFVVYGLWLGVRDSYFVINDLWLMEYRFMI